MLPSTLHGIFSLFPFVRWLTEDIWPARFVDRVATFSLELEDCVLERHYLLRTSVFSIVFCKPFCAIVPIGMCCVSRLLLYLYIISFIGRGEIKHSSAGECGF